MIGNATSVSKEKDVEDLKKNLVEQIANRKMDPVVYCSELIPGLSELLFLLMRREELLLDINQMPSGSLLHHARNQLGIQYFHEGKRHEAYVPARLRARIIELYERRESLNRELETVNNRIMALKPDDNKLFMEAVSEAKSMREQKLKTFSYPHPKNYIHQTLRGEFVASKSEALIADYLFLHGIKYEYSPKCVLAGIVLYPDFKIYVGDKVFYLEHLGRLDDVHYSAEWQYKLSVYRSAGITTDNGLIITRDYNGAIYMRHIERVFRHAGIITT